MTHDVDGVLREARNGREVRIPAGWGQGRATFGGLVAGVLVARTLGELGAPQETLRSVTTNFVAPVSSGPAVVDVEVLRQGSSATQVEARLRQADDVGDVTVRAVALLTFGAPRSSAVEVIPAPADRVGDIGSLEAIPYVPGVAPEFIGRVDLRPVTGALAFSGAPDGDLTGYMRFREQTEEFSVAHLVTLVDAWPPAPAQMLSRPAALSTMTWTLEFISDVPADPSITWWYDVVTDAAHDGYAHTQARIHDDAGRLVAISRQTIALFG